MCQEHDLAESECGICHPELTKKLAPGESLKVRLPSKESAALAGIRTAAPAVGAVARGVECYAELAFDQNRLARIAAPVGGIVQSVEVDLGSKVEEKQTVARIWSASIAEAVAKAVLSHQTLERERKLRAGRVTSEQDLQRAEAEHRAACQQLRTLGFTEEQIDTLGAEPQDQVLMEVRAPFAGEIVERSAVRGALVETGTPLFTVADRSRMWAMLNIPEAALGQVRIGQPVELQVEAMPGQTFAGTLTWIAAEVDERSRMAKARAEVPNPDATLKARMFARARVLTEESPNAVLLPASAVQKVAGRDIVFVQVADDLFEARAVRVGAEINGRVEITQGVEASDPVVVEHGFPLKSAFLISRLGAGCADD
jgi:cobalt-zinc-cadmium efflux system membrane fusion protein